MGLGLNQGPRDYRSRALPAELPKEKSTFLWSELQDLNLRYSCSQSRCHTRLGEARIKPGGLGLLTQAETLMIGWAGLPLTHQLIARLARIKGYGLVGPVRFELNLVPGKSRLPSHSAKDLLVSIFSARRFALPVFPCAPAWQSFAGTTTGLRWASFGFRGFIVVSWLTRKSGGRSGI